MRLFNPVIMYSLPRTKTWAVLFVLGFFIGIAAFDFIAPYIFAMFEKTFTMTKGKSLTDMSIIASVLVIFTKNALVALLCILTARITFGLYPGLVVIFNGLLIGFVSTMLVSHGDITALQMFGGLAPHGFIELFGICLACAIGFLKIPIKTKLQYSSLVWVSLFIAAVIESTITNMIVATF